MTIQIRQLNCIRQIPLCVRIWEKPSDAHIIKIGRPNVAAPAAGTHGKQKYACNDGQSPAIPETNKGNLVATYYPCGNRLPTPKPTQSRPDGCECKNGIRDEHLDTGQMKPIEEPKGRARR